ncbi:TetR/AcrR family transcriptional regulator [Lactobacillaceae bacterium Scapto_B20]
MNKTKDRIADAFLILLESKQDDEITNNEIINKSGISKGTFYNNFGSKADISTYMYHQIDSQIIKSLVQYNEYLKHQNSIEAILRCTADTTIPAIYEKRERIRILYRSSLSGEWQKYLEKKYLKLICTFYNKREDDDFHLRLLVKYALDIISLWITSPIPTPPDQFKDEFYQLFNVNIKDIV